MYYVYLLQSEKNRSTYIGYTSDLKKRFAEHNQGKTKSIKHSLPYRLTYYEAYQNKTDARKREIELKENSYQKEQLFKRIQNSFMASSSNG
ncbi:excinuclease ABC subunit C [Candidatus Falkowbacteria bacterium CG10_big_fil_rev_8_21_14_0_10_43_11]|uniref:Excinuclease ABC subunit C n=1 Tax=Candidatus Falkowbacteria bacterium CG10_big_fil_rev_8_21_14_0_10_43_11 TaxID=1974568 RepID=A0A2M6WLF2_9BACT|nr:MAG: excinuclease ABC subunit C [Candidatus Falkowbacteria bacterium CG10_big_fil_rev_8_21_14_0_10_43_11]